MTGLLVALVAILQFAGGDRETWTDFAPEGAGFSVRMPSEPKETKVTARPPAGMSGVKQFVATDAGCTFAVKYGQATNPRDPAKTNLARVKKGFLAANKTAGPGEDIQQGDHPGWETEYTVSGGRGVAGSAYKVRFYVVGKTVIELATIVPTSKAKARAEDIAAFFDSFKLDEEATPKAPTVAASGAPAVAAPEPPAEVMPKAAPAEPKWAVFKPAGGGFSVKLPGKVSQNRVTQASPAGPITVLSFIAGDSEQQFTVSRVDPPATAVLANPKAEIDSFRDGFIKTIQGQLTSEKEIKQGGRAGREIEVQIPESIVPGGRTLRTRVFILDGKLYAITATTANPDLPQRVADVTKFLDSFELVGKAGDVEIKADEWAEFTPPDGSFTVLMPGTPQLKTQSVPSPLGPQEVVTYTGVDLPLVFLVVHSPMPNGALSGPQLKASLDRGTEGFLRGANAKLLDQGDIAPNGVAGRQFRAKAANGRIITGRVLPTGDRLYQLLVEMPEGQPNTEKVGKFLDSFKLAGSKPTSGTPKASAPPNGP